MQAVLLAAGKGVRVMPFTCTRPKPMIPVANKPILQHDIEQLEGLVDEVILVVGYLKEKIQDYFGTVFNGMKITYVEQKEYLGTGHALLQAEKLINGKFIVMYGDDLYHCDDIKSCLAHDLCVLVKNVANPGMFGIINSQDGKVADIVEKPENPESNLANTGLYVFDKSIFPILESVSRSKRGEYELTDAVLELSKLRDIYCETVRKSWIPMGYLHNILDANEIKVAEVFEAGGSFIDKNSVVEDGAVLKGDVKIGSGTVVRAGTYIEGPCIIGENSKIGPNAYIRSGTVIGDNCHIGASVELKNTIVMNNSNVPHLSYLGDSVIGESVNLGAGTIGANLRHDNDSVKISYGGGVLVDTCRRKLGCFVADFSKTGIKTMLYPGAVLGPFSWTGAGETVKENVKPFELLLDGTIKRLSFDKFEKVLMSAEDHKVMERLYSYIRA